MSREFKIDARYIYPVSESCLELALYDYVNPHIIPTQKKLAHQIIQVYLLQEFLNQGEEYLEESEFVTRFEKLVKDFENRVLVMANYADVAYNDTEDKFEFLLTKNGKDAVAKIIGKS